MQVLCHHIYEYKKGLRFLVLHTLPAESQEEAEMKLKRQKIDYVIQAINQTKINIFFGNEICVDIVRGFGNKRLNELSAEEDFLLGTMLGYDRLQQCQRYQKKKGKEHLFLRKLFCFQS